MNSLLTPPRPMLSRPDEDDLAALMSVRGLCVSILVTTSPGPRLSEADRQRIQAHVRDVVRRLELEPDQGQAAVLASRMRTAVDRASRMPADADADSAGSVGAAANQRRQERGVTGPVRRRYS